MKIQEYITDTHYLNKENCIQLHKYVELIESFVSSNSKYMRIELSEDILHETTIQKILQPIKNKIIFMSNVDIDFPPPKKPYSYDKYFYVDNLPSNYETLNYYDKIEKDIIQIIEENNLHIISMSVSICHPNITFIPLGIYSRFNHFHMKHNKKDILCYLNMGIPCDRWFGNPRKIIINSLTSNHEFIVKKTNLSMDEFYNDISKSKFMICPRGCGIDTYRLWDCIMLGCIPIVEKYESHNSWNDLPILFLDNIRDYELLTEDFLNRKYDKFLEKDFNYDKCTNDYWYKKICIKNI